ncbi:type II toxin-antitoxin system death-on-curing family toxin [Sphingobacterium sp. KU25419]|nr:type II toxin-antitoxin system death-on-curing family toxin [Sphingobacterium sp. KU25419]
MKDDFYYPCFEDKLSHLVFSVIKNHAFNDGNKRSAIGLGAMFLELNGLSSWVPKFIIELENIVVYVAANFISKDLLHDIISSILNSEYHCEELKLNIFNALSFVNNNLEFENKGSKFYINLF